MDTEHAMKEIDLPIGYRFLPTDEELIRCYLTNKVFNRPIPSQVIQDIDADEFYSKGPNALGQTNDLTVLFQSYEDSMKNFYGDMEWYVFIHQDESFHGKERRLRMVGNEIGFWRCFEDEEPIYDSDGNVFAFKIHFTYFSGSAKRTKWRMEEYRLRIQYGQEHQEMDKWVLGKISKGRYCVRDYISRF